MFNNIQGTSFKMLSENIIIYSSVICRKKYILLQHIYFLIAQHQNSLFVVILWKFLTPQKEKTATPLVDSKRNFSDQQTGKLTFTTTWAITFKIIFFASILFTNATELFQNHVPWKKTRTYYLFYEITRYVTFHSNNIW